MSDLRIRASNHPWGAFLHARARALRWLRDEMKETPEKTARTMSMDPTQVRLILEHVDAHGVEEDSLPATSKDQE
jgi:hypothetical protein